MPRIDKPKKTLKKKVTKKQTKKSVVVKVSKPKSLKSKPIKSPVAYFGCMAECCRKGISPKKITEVAHECKTNALAVKKRMSAQKKKDLTELARKHEEFRKVLGNYVKKY
jgi:hypothetical protein